MRRPGGSELGRPEQEEARRPRAAEAPGIHGRGGDGGEQRGVEVAHGARRLRRRPAAGAEATKVARRRPRAAEGGASDGVRQGEAAGCPQRPRPALHTLLPCWGSRHTPGCPAVRLPRLCQPRRNPIPAGMYIRFTASFILFF